MLSSNPLDMANNFNNFFCKVGENIALSIPKNMVGLNDPTTYLQGNYVPSLYLSPTDEFEVLKTFKSCKPSSSVDADGLSQRVFASIFNLILTPVTNICNLSLQKGIFPHRLKITRVIPIYKKGDKTLPSNYRPISLLPFLSKILEKIFKVRLQNFLDKHKVITENQYGFTPGKSTRSAVMDYL